MVFVSETKQTANTATEVAKLMKEDPKAGCKRVLTFKTFPLGPRTLPEKFILLALGLAAASASSLIASWISVEVGLFATGDLGEQLQVALVGNITSYIRGKMDPLRIYLQQGVDLWDEMRLDLTKWEDLQITMGYQRAFLENYFDESRCCSGMFVNMDYDHNDDGVDDSLSCHAIMSPNCRGTATGSMASEIAAQDLGGNALWAAVLHYSDTYTSGSYPGLDNLEFTADSHSGDMVQVLPGNLSGAKDNEAYFRYYNHSRSLSPWRGAEGVVGTEDMRDGEGNEVMKAGFVHWPIVDGFWYRDIQLHDMQKGEVRFASRVFPWTLYPPAVLKSHAFTPLFSPSGERVGGWVTGFKLHWIASFLEETAKAVEGMFIFIVEKKTGVLITTSDPAVAVLKNYDTSASIDDVIMATECDDGRVAQTAKEVVELANATASDWSSVTGTLLSRAEISTNSKDASNENFVIAQSFEYLGLDWVVVLSIPSGTITKAIDSGAEHRTNIILIVAMGLALVKTLIRFGALKVFFHVDPWTGADVNEAMTSESQKQKSDDSHPPVESVNNDENKVTV